MAFDVVVENASEVLTLGGDRRNGGEAALAIVSGGVIGIRGGVVEHVGTSLPADAIGPSTVRIDARGGVVGPGFVDAHTHVVFAGERSREFELRARGASYLEIAQAGGGIANTMAATRAASEDELVALARPRLQRMLAQGITTAEAKSGYGLNVADEVKILRAVKRLSEEGPIELYPTLLCAHAIPPEYKEDRAGYLKLCVDEIIPAAKGLAKGFDVFCEQSAFTKDETRMLCSAAKSAELSIRLHVDQLTPGGGAELAAEIGAISADHLEQVSDAGIAALARAAVSGVLVPTATFFLKLRGYAPGRKLWDAGVNVALGTNVNPGSAMSENFAFTLSLAVLENGLSAAEALFAATRGAALSLGLPELGALTPGSQADLVVFGCRSYRHLPYHLGISHARVVLKKGRVVFRSADEQAAPCA